VIECSVLVLFDDLSVFSLAVCGLSLSLASAGIKMLDVVAAVEGLTIKDKIYMDVSLKENECINDSDFSNQPVQRIAIATMSNLNQITYIQQSTKGNSTNDGTNFESLVRKCLAICTERRTQLCQILKADFVAKHLELQKELIV